MATIYLGISEFNGGLEGAHVICAGFKRESVRKRLEEHAGEVLQELGDSYRVTEKDPIYPDAIEVTCSLWPKHIRYRVIEVDIIDEK